MEIIIFCGLQASGKSTFYKEKFFNSHVRISMDLLRTRHREKSFIDLCYTTEKSFVVDNTNPSLTDRERYISEAKLRKIKVIGYYFQSKLEDSIERNGKRQGKELIPIAGIRNTYNKLELPSRKEGFDELYYVQIVDNQFKIEEWNDEF